MDRKQWFKEAKFGMMIHFGLYSLLAGEWKGKRMDMIAEWAQSCFQIPIKEYEKLVDFVNPDGKAKIIITTAWYPLKALNKDLIEFAKRRNITIVDIGKIYHQEGMKATGLWKHAGVASHPSDKGMKALAEAYFQALTQQK